MPLHEFICPLGHRIEELYGRDDEIPPAMPCHCGNVARRNYVVRVNFKCRAEALDRAEAALLTPAQREAGARFRSESEVEAFEQANNLHRLSEYEERVGYEEMKEQAIEDRTLIQREGDQAFADKVQKDTITETTGWDSSQYHRWKDTYDAAERALESGALQPPDAALAG